MKLKLEFWRRDTGTMATMPGHEHQWEMRYGAMRCDCGEVWEVRVGD